MRNLQSYTVDGMLHSGHRNQRSEIQLIGVGEYGNLVSGKGSSSDKAAFFSDLIPKKFTHKKGRKMQQKLKGGQKSSKSSSQ